MGAGIMQRIAIMLLIFLIGTVAAGCRGVGGLSGGNPAGQPVWGMDGGNAQRQGVSSLPGPTAANLDWLFLDNAGFQQARLGPDGRCYIQCQYAIVCVDDAGQPRWRFNDLAGLISGMYFSPSGLLYVVSWDSRLLALDAGGKLAEEYQLATTWRGGSAWFAPEALYLLQQEPPTEPLMPAGDNYVLNAFSLTGGPRWQQEIHGYGFRIAGVAADQVYLVRTTTTPIDENEPVALTYSMAGGLLFQVAAAQRGYYTGQVSADGHLYLLSSAGFRCYSPAGEQLLAVSRDDLPITRLLAPDAGDAVYATTSLGVLNQTLRLHPDGSFDVLFEHRSMRFYAVPGGRALIEYEDYYPQRLAVVEHDGRVVHDWLAPDTLGTEEHDLSFNGESILYFGRLQEGPATSALAPERNTLHKLAADWQLEWSFIEWMGTAYTTLVDGRGRLVSLGSGEGLVLDPSGQQEAYKYFDGSYIDLAVLQPGSGRLITYAAGGMLRAYEPDFTPAWEQPAAEVDELAATADRLAYASDELVYVLDAEGNQLLQLEADGYWANAPSLGADDTLYFTDPDSLYAYQPDGTQLFKIEHQNFYGVDSLVCPNGNVIVQSTRKLTAFSRNGELRWEFERPELSLSKAVVDQAGKLYFTAHSSALDATPAPLTSAGTHAAGAAGDDELVSGMYALNAGGEELWFTPLRSADDEAVGLNEQPLLDSQGRIYASARYLYAFAVDPQGQLLWRYQLPTSGSSKGHNAWIRAINIIGGSRLAIRTYVGYVVVGN